MNETIQEARDAARNVLQPSQKDLEHGLELHANSLVIESYGFAPRSAIDGDAMAKAMEDGASDLEIQHLREDMILTRVATDANEKKEFMDAWDASGVTCILQNAGEESQDAQTLIRRLANFTFVSDLLPDFAPKAVTPDDIVAAKEAGRHCFYLTCNGVPLNQHWRSLEEELEMIRIFFQFGSRMMHLTYNRRNMVGDGCMESADAGLSDFGRAVVKEMNRVGVIVDVAHSGWRTSLEAAKVSDRPMVASHSGCVALNNHPRCKPDEVIEAIVESGGNIGICCIPHFLGGSQDINAVLDHIDYVARKFGVDHVTIGTDVAYTSRANEAEVAKLPSRPEVRRRWENFWPEGTRARGDTPPQKVLSMAWTNWPMFTVGLVQRGYSDEDIQKIIGGNVLRVARAVWPG